MACSFCSKDKVYAKGLCQTCYNRQLRTGKLEYTRKFIKPTDTCTVEGCYKRVVAGGLCDKHYMMVKRRGDVHSNFGYGERQTHPLYHAWCYQVRVKEKRVSAWDDFWQFVADVGEKPSAMHVSRRHDLTKPWGPDNFVWLQREVGTVSNAENQRRWRDRNPLKSKSLSLKKCYGLTITDYLSMYDAQGGKCYICGTEKASYTRGDAGKSQTLVVDHCHSRGHIRKLLCADCNKALGGFKDRPDLLRKAAEYLEEDLDTCPVVKSMI